MQVKHSGIYPPFFERGSFESARMVYVLTKKCRLHSPVMVWHAVSFSISGYCYLRNGGIYDHPLLYFYSSLIHTTVINLLCLGDAHLGRYPSRVPTNDPTLSVGAVWEQAISYSINNNIDAMILTGDMADNKNSYFEAYGTLRAGITRLIESHIPVVAIAGNHDYDVFPELAKSMEEDNFHFLGLDGAWSEVTLNAKSGRPIRCIGWSFPSPHYDHSPLDSLTLSQSDAFTIGVIHGELDGRGNYAPLAKQDLAALPVDLWLLGHVHAPKLYQDSSAPVLYAGSLQALDPGEPGIHGPWTISINENNHIDADQQPLASVRYEEVQINLSGLDRMADVSRSIAEQLEKIGQELIQHHSPLRFLSCRLILEGQTKLHRVLSTEGLTNIDTLDLQIDGCTISVDKVTVNTSPSRDLYEISQLNNDPPGILARWLLELENSNHPDLLKCAGDAAASVYGSAGFRGLGDKTPSSETLSRLVTQQAMLLLDELLAQKEDHE